jgi:hypothetical protein
MSWVVLLSALEPHLVLSKLKDGSNCFYSLLSHIYLNLFSILATTDWKNASLR